jgi:hypothetical protein
VLRATWSNEETGSGSTVSSIKTMVVSRSTFSVACMLFPSLRLYRFDKA